MFNLHYDDQGNIVGYQEFTGTPDATPEGMNTLCYEGVPPIFSADGRLTHKVDMTTFDLVPLKVMPKPIQQAQGTLTLATG